MTLSPTLAVLYVEDDPASRKVMQLLLKGRLKLHHAMLFEDSSNFVERVLALDPVPNIIFLDIHVKPLDGFEMLHLLRELPKFKGVPIIALTASVMNEEVQKLLTAGFDGCLAKPIDLETFAGMVQRILNGEVVWHITA
jgi:CheY-like chemotaxis protein